MKDITINAGNLTKTYGTGTPLIVQLLDENNNPIQGLPFKINIHGVDYNRTSDVNGQGKLNINLEPGTYLTTIKFDGNATYNPAMKSIVVSVVTYTIQEQNTSKNNEHYFEVNTIPFKVLKNNGFDSETGVSITRTRLLHSNQFNNVPTHNFNQGNAGVSFEVSLMIRPEYIHEGKQYSYYLENWEKYQKVVDVVTNAFDIPNGKYTLTIKSRKQTNTWFSIWKVEFYQYYEGSASFGGADLQVGAIYSSVDKTLINADTTIDSSSNSQYIEALQQKLIDAGYFEAGTTPTGEWSDELTQDLVNFQKDNELAMTGVADWDTVSKITAVDKIYTPDIDPSKIIFNGVIGL